jgi:Ca-activated chloride channel homolog
MAVTRRFAGFLWGLAMRTVIAAFLLVLGLSGLLSAQTTSPVLLTSEGGGAASNRLRLAKVDVDVRILGSLAETKMTLVFANPEDRQREGDLYFPLPEGAVACGYALDIDGKMIDGVVVESQHARSTYESFVSRQKDPALLELVHGNTFRARVFPIPASGTRTIAVRYMTDLATGADGPLLYRLPLDFKEKLDEFRLRIEVPQGATAPKVVSGRPADMVFATADGICAAEKTLKGVALTEPLVLALPGIESQGVTVEKADDGKVYFCVRTPAPPEPAETAPKRITILWDASGSRADMDHSSERKTLAALFDRWSKAPVTVDLVVFRHVPEPTKTFTIEGGRAEALLAAIDSVDYDGGTRLANLKPAKPAAPPDLYLLFSDGFPSMGDERLPNIEFYSLDDPPDLRSFPLPKERPAAFDAPVYIFAQGKLMYDLLLRDIVVRSGGMVIDMDHVTAAEAARRVGRPLSRLAPVEVVDGKVDGLSPSAPQFLTGGPVVTGRLVGDSATLKVTCGRTSADMKTTQVAVSAKDAPRGNLLRFVWGMHRLKELEGAYRPDQNKIVALSKECGVVTPYTSLIVLETLEQHVQFQIRPPDMLPEMQKAYDAKVKSPAPAKPAPEPVMANPAAEPAVNPHDPTQNRLYNVLVPLYYRIALWDDIPEYPADFKYKPTAGDVTAPGGAGGSLKGSGAGYPFSDGSGSGPGTPAGQFAGRMIVVAGGSGIGGAGPLTSTFGGGGGGGGGAVYITPTLPAGPAPALPAVLANPMTDILAMEPAPTATAAVTATASPQRPTAGGPIEVAPAVVNDTTYLKTLADAPADKVWAVYMAERKKHATSPDFFVNASTVFLARGMEPQARQVMTNLAELDFQWSARTLALMFLMRGRPDLAAAAYDQFGSEDNPWDAVALYELAILRESQGRLPEAAELLMKVINNDMSFTSAGIEVTALVDLNRLLPKLDPAVVKRLGLNKRLVKRMDADLRVVIMWDTPADVDLLVTEPSGETCFYDHAATTIGGFLWSDTNDGGPEEYVLRKAMPGRYKVEVLLSEMTAEQPMAGVRPPTPPVVTVRVEIYTHFAQPGEKHESLVVELHKTGEMKVVKELDLGPAPRAADRPAGP